jgi:predicted transcriptional regulator
MSEIAELMARIRETKQKIEEHKRAIEEAKASAQDLMVDLKSAYDEVTAEFGEPVRSKRRAAVLKVQRYLQENGPRAPRDIVRDTRVPAKMVQAILRAHEDKFEHRRKGEWGAKEEAALR